MTNEEIARYLDDAHKAMTLAGQSASGGNPNGGYEMTNDAGEAIPTFDKLAEAVRANAV